MELEDKYGIIDIHAYDEGAFRISCVKGYLDVAKWLVDLGLGSKYGKINIHSDNDYIFRNISKENNLHKIKWIIDLCIYLDDPIDAELVSKMLKLEPAPPIYIEK